MMVLHGLIYYINKHGTGPGIPGNRLVVWYMGKTPYICGTVCVDGMVREKRSIWYDTLTVWYDGRVSWMYYMANLPDGVVCFSIYKIGEGRIRGTNFTCNHFIYRSLKSVGKYNTRGQTDGQTDIFAT